MTIKIHPSNYVHPGLWLRAEIVEPYRLSVTNCAARLGVSRPAMSHLLNGRAALSAEMAIRFEKAFGISADTLLRMQSAYELAQVRTHASDIAVERIPEPA